jgi:hypothetical protein
VDKSIVYGLGDDIETLQRVSETSLVAIDAATYQEEEQDSYNTTRGKPGSCFGDQDSHVSVQSSREKSVSRFST